MSDDVVIVFSTFSTRDEAERVGEGLVERHLAACGNVIPTVHSFYFWDGKLQRESEAILMLKTTAAHVAEIAETIRSEGSYDTPEVLAVRAESGLPAYLQWIVGEVGRGGRPA